MVLMIITLQSYVHDYYTASEETQNVSMVLKAGSNLEPHNSVLPVYCVLPVYKGLINTGYVSLASALVSMHNTDECISCTFSSRLQGNL